MTGRECGGRGPTRRELLLGTAALGAGALTFGGVDRLVDRGDRRAATATLENGGDRVPFHGRHQAGIATAAPAFLTLLAFDVHEDVDRAALRRLMRLLSDDAARLTQGLAPLADTEPELSIRPARLTITFGFGPGFIGRAGGDGAGRVRALPAWEIDRLEEAWSDGDLVAQVCSDDPVTNSHAARMLLKDARAFASVRWMQQGFREARGTAPDGSTMRNLFGQLDGTANPAPGSSEFDAAVWIADDSWLDGGTTLVVRRVAMDLDGWDLLDRPGRELSVGRRIDTGAPLTGTREHDEPDLDARGPDGLRVIPEFSHVARARAAGTTVARRSYNYEGAARGTTSDAGLVFLAYQADVERQFVPIQESLAELDQLNEWTTPIGSAVFAIPPGCAPGGWVGETLLA